MRRPVAISRKTEQRKGCPRSRCLRSGVYYWTPPSTGTPEIRLYRGREVMRRVAGCQRHKASSHRYDREEVVNSGGSLRCAVGDSSELRRVLTSTVSWRCRPRRARDVSRPAYPLLVEAIGEGELSAALAPKVCAFRVPHRKGSAEHHSLPTLFTHEDDPPGRTVHLPTPLFSCGGRLTAWHTQEATTTSTSF